jgi:acyl-coenzyme A synthetase/AMP-(fatty) acid ligase
LDNLPTALTATTLIKRPETPVIVIDAHKSPEKLPYPSLEDLVQEGQSLSPFIETKLRSGEAKTKIAFLCFSSGTTGKPKALTHHLSFLLLIDYLTGCRHLALQLDMQRRSSGYVQPNQ